MKVSDAADPTQMNPRSIETLKGKSNGRVIGVPTDLNNATLQYQYQYGGPPTTYGQLANMEWYRMLAGTANFQSGTAFNDVYAGRYGEQGSVLVSAFNQGITAGSISQTPPNLMPWPGVSLSDDNWNKYEGEFAAEANSSTPGIQQLSQFVLRFTPNPPTVPAFFPTQIPYYAP